MPKNEERGIVSVAKGLHYSAIGLDNRDIFLAQVNDVLVYCEDENWEEFYISLLGRLDLGVSINSIFCLGGKTKMLKKIKEPPEAGKKRLFVFDKDFDDLLGSIVTSQEAAYLGRYSVENYFFSVDLMSRYIVNQKKGVRRESVISSLPTEEVDSFMQWYSDVCRYFVVAQKFKLGLETTKLELRNIALLPSGERNEVWWRKYLEKFTERVQTVAPHLMNDGALDRALEDAYVSVPRCAHVSDQSKGCHFPGKHLLDFAIAKVSEFLGRYDSEEVRYKLMMTSIPYLPDNVVDDISARFKAVIER